MSFINSLHFNNIRGDIYGGITAGVIQQIAEGHVCEIRREALEKAGTKPGVDVEKTRSQQAEES
ncbi:MAG: hypothetical protein KAJ65_07240 [Gammaproteobacteria bacterium]|jgi:hypothetical protein|nr:hypothetical protein [Gammaproteobacteria bacterium]